MLSRRAPGSRLTRPALAGLVAAALLAVAAFASVTLAQTAAGDDLMVVREGAVPTNQELSIRLSEVTTPPDQSVVVLAAADSFPDALTSAVLQGLGPLLLVEPDQPLSDRVQAELRRVSPDTVIVLGGPVAVPEAITAELSVLGYRVDRIQGATRIDTAIEIARAGAPSATTALLVRAFGTDESTDPTQGFVDALAAGPLATSFGAPVLLTDSGALTPATAAYLAGSSIDTVVIVGGESAVSRTIEHDLLTTGYAVDRIGGRDRVETSLALNAARGALEAPDRVVVVDGTAPDGWAAGFTASRHAAATGAPIILTAGPDVPAATAAYLASESGTRAATKITCLATPAGCRAVRAAGGIAPRPSIGYSPQIGSVLEPGGTLVITLDDPERVLTDEVEIGADCLDAFEDEIDRSIAVVDVLTVEEVLTPEPTPTPTAPTPTASPGPTEGEEDAPDVDDVAGSCLVTITGERTDGVGTFTEVAGFIYDAFFADFRVATVPNAAGDEVVFQDTSEGLVDQWAWDFGDGTTSALQDPVHVYEDPGTYDVTLTVTTASGSTDSITLEVEIR